MELHDTYIPLRSLESLSRLPFSDVTFPAQQPKARTDGRVLQLTEAIEQMRMAHDRDHTKAMARDAVIKERISNLEGYNVTRTVMPRESALPGGPPAEGPCQHPAPEERHRKRHGGQRRLQVQEAVSHCLRAAGR